VATTTKKEAVAVAYICRPGGRERTVFLRRRLYTVQTHTHTHKHINYIRERAKTSGGVYIRARCVCEGDEKRRSARYPGGSKVRG